MLFFLIIKQNKNKPFIFLKAITICMDVLLLQVAKPDFLDRNLSFLPVWNVSVSTAYSLNVESLQICVYVINCYIFGFLIKVHSNKTVQMNSIFVGNENCSSCLQPSHCFSENNLYLKCYFIRLLILFQVCGFIHWDRKSVV